MSVVVVAIITPLPEYRDEVIAAFAATIAQVHAEDGCELYALHQAPDRLVMVEKWASRDALATHSKGAALAALNPQLAGKVSGRPEVIVLDAVPAGDAAKGQL
ncbi:MAG TPA: putative quinol monooxygenase [Streptosporangiaceae bacterium]|nr:putative quinol monooxygenase [Streptosporangiaceae bacterium]